MRILESWKRYLAVDNSSSERVFFFFCKKVKLLDFFCGGRTCRSSAGKTKVEWRADGCRHVCVCVLVCDEATPCVTGSQRGRTESADTLRSSRSVTPSAVWTMRSATIFTFNSTFLKHPVSSICEQLYLKKDFKGNRRKPFWFFINCPCDPLS